MQASLSKVWLRWDRVAVMESPVAYSRKVIARELVSQARKMSFGERPTAAAALIGAPARDLTSEVDDADAVWSLLRRLPARQQAVLRCGSARISPIRRSQTCSTSARRRSGPRLRGGWRRCVWN